MVFLPQGVLPFDSDAFVNIVFILSSSNGHRGQNWQHNKINNKINGNEIFFYLNIAKICQNKIKTEPQEPEANKSKKPNKLPKATQAGEARKHPPTQQRQKQKSDWQYVNWCKIVCKFLSLDCDCGYESNARARRLMEPRLRAQ